MQMVCSNAGTLCSGQLECPDGFRPPGHCCDMCGKNGRMSQSVKRDATSLSCFSLVCMLTGAMMRLTVDEGIFTKSALDRLVSSMLKDEPATHSYSYRTASNVIHLTVVDNTTNERSISIANKIQDYLLKGILSSFSLNDDEQMFILLSDKASGTNVYGILSLELFRSGFSHSPSHHLSPEEWRLIVSNLASTFVTFIILGLVGAGLYYYKRHGYTAKLFT